MAKEHGHDSVGTSISRRVIALITGLSVVLSVITLFIIRGMIFAELDDNLRESIHTQWRAASGSSNANVLPGGVPRKLAPGNVTIVTAFDGATSAILVGDKGRIGAPGKDTVAAMLSVPHDGKPRDIFLAEFGVYYRVIAVDSRADLPPVSRMPESATAPLRVISGSPLKPLRLQMLTILLSAIAVSGCVIILCRWGIDEIVDSSLAPLRTLARNAEKVSTMDLERGTVELSELREVDEAKDEISQVSTAFATMLDHVDRSLTARARSENKLKQFVADASHELRNPLTAIRGYAEITGKYGTGLDENTAFAVERIIAESHRMSSLVEDMLLLARLDTEPSLDVFPVDLTELLIHAVGDARIAGPDHEWRLTLPTDFVEIEGDRQRLAQVFINILSNARIHTPAGSCVVTTLDNGPEEVVITIADNGPGVDEEFIAIAFERFARGDAARTYTGTNSSTGLGLAIVDSIVAAHHGSVSIHNDNGAVFTVRLPHIHKSQGTVETSFPDLGTGPHANPDA